MQKSLYKVKHSTAFKRELKIARRRGYNMGTLNEVVDALADGKSLDPKHNDHALIGNWKGYRECHITPDWLLIYKIDAGVLILTLQRTGTHSDLF